MSHKGQSFTYSAQGLLRSLISQVWVGPAFVTGTQTPPVKQYMGIWDTGATSSVITEKIVTECGLKQIGITEAHGADGKYLAEVYLISLSLPNAVGWASITVTKGKLGPGCDMLVGMDVIGQGDFAVTNHRGQTCFSYRYPSAEKIDFTGMAPRTARFEKYPNTERNAPCPCNSGKKYKKCHGSANPPP
jgi:hypothetical protein